jgi:integrase
MATIRVRKGTDGTKHFHVQVRLRGHPPTTATFERRTDAKIWVQKTETAMRDGRHFPTHEAKRRTLSDLVDRYLEQTQTKRPAAYYERKKHLLTWWKKKLGDYTLAQVTPALIAEYRDKLLRENRGDKKNPRHRGPATANRYLSALSKAFTDAVREWNWLPDNPLRRVTKEQESAGRVRYLSDAERKALLQACEKSELPELHLIVLLALTTGMRRGEILGLRWQDIDLQRRLIVLNKTKNRERRSVPIVPAVAALLKAHGKVRRLGSEMVFPPKQRKQKDGTDPTVSSVTELRPVQGEGQPTNGTDEPAANAPGPLWFDEYWYAALDAARIKDFRFHDLRHTAASYLAMSGATTAEIAAVLGHKTLQMVKRYAHLSDQHTSAVVERMTRKFFGS